MSAALQFPGGPVEVAKPSQAALLESASQWVNALKGELHELTACLESGYTIEPGDAGLRAMRGQVAHLSRVIAELVAP